MDDERSSGAARHHRQAAPVRPRAPDRAHSETPLPRGVEGRSVSLARLYRALDRLEERFGIVIQEGEDVAAHFGTFGASFRFVGARAQGI
jgi:hypothetical protein